jgi:hypothetical protein
MTPHKKSLGSWRYWLCVLACLSWEAYAQNAREPIYDFRSAAAMAVTLENRNGQYLLSFTNNTEHELRGYARLSLGTDGAQSEMGQLPVLIPANETKLYLLKGLTVRGEFYTLRLYNSNQAMLFYKMTTVRRVSDGVPAQAEAVILNGHSQSITNSTPTIAPAVVPAVSQPAPDEIQVKIRLAAGAQPNDPLVVAFEISSQRSLFDATLQMALGSTKATKPVSINRQAIVEFNAPPEVGDGKLTYALLRKDGSVAVQGETSLDKLFSDDVITVSDIRTDKTGYAPGETARLTIVLEGHAPEGYRLEITAHDAQDNQFFSTVLYGKEDMREQPLLLSLANDAAERVVLKFKLYDASNNALFDSGEREITVNAKP